MNHAHTYTHTLHKHKIYIYVKTERVVHTVFMLYGAKYSLHMFRSQALCGRTGEVKESHPLAITYELTPEFDININPRFT
jgi:hypothetical protein